MPSLWVSLDSALQGCHAVITGWAHGPKQRTEYTVDSVVPAEKWHPAIGNFLHQSTWHGGVRDQGWVVVKASLGKGCQF